MSNNSLNNLTTTAQKLWSIEKKLEKKKDAYIKATLPLEEAKNALRNDLLVALVTSSLKSVKVESGDVFARSTRTTYKITDEAKAFTWASTNNCTRVDTIKANKILLHKIGTPDGFEKNTTEFISIRKSND